MAVLEIQANGDTAVSKEAVVNAGQSLEDPPMRVSLRNTPRPKYTPVQPWKRKDKLSHAPLFTLAHVAPCFSVYFVSFRVTDARESGSNWAAL